MKRGLLLYALSTVLSLEGGAKDFGVHGHMFDIMEEDLLSQLRERLQTLEKTGDLERHQRTLLSKVRDKMKTPQPVPGLKRARTPRVMTYDPSLTVPYDLKDSEGRVFQKAGTRVNPLQNRPLTKDLVFFDARDPVQVHWVAATYVTSGKPAKLILTGGRPFDLMARWQVPLYFDQQGSLTSKFKIKALPAVLRQKETYLEIREIVLEK